MNPLKVAKLATDKIALAYEEINLVLRRTDVSKIPNLFC